MFNKAILPALYSAFVASVIITVSPSAGAVIIVTNNLPSASAVVVISSAVIALLSALSPAVIL